MDDMVTPDPMNPEFGIDAHGNLCRHTILDMGDMQIDMGYSLASDEEPE